MCSGVELFHRLQKAKRRAEERRRTEGVDVRCWAVDSSPGTGGTLADETHEKCPLFEGNLEPISYIRRSVSVSAPRARPIANPWPALKLTFYE